MLRREAVPEATVELHNHTLCTRIEAQQVNKHIHRHAALSPHYTATWLPEAGLLGHSNTLRVLDEPRHSDGLLQGPSIGRHPCSVKERCLEAMRVAAP